MIGVLSSVCVCFVCGGDFQQECNQAFSPISAWMLFFLCPTSVFHCCLPWPHYRLTSKSFDQCCSFWFYIYGSTIPPCGSVPHKIPLKLPTCHQHTAVLLDLLEWIPGIVPFSQRNRSRKIGKCNDYKKNASAQQRTTKTCFFFHCCAHHDDQSIFCG